MNDLSYVMIVKVSLPFKDLVHFSISSLIILCKANILFSRTC